MEKRQQVVGSVLRILAVAAQLQDQREAIKRDLILSHLSMRLAISEELLRARLKELRAARRPEERDTRRPQATDGGEAKRRAPAAPHERELLQVLLRSEERRVGKEGGRR